MPSSRRSPERRQTPDTDCGLLPASGAQPASGNGADARRADHGRRAATTTTGHPGLSLISIASIVDAAGGRVRQARFACGGLAPRPWRVPAADAVLAGQPADASTLDRAADLLLQGAAGHGQNDFKIPLTRRLLGHVLAEAARPSQEAEHA